MEKFEKEIAPKIDDQLRNVDLGYADIFVRLYMMGSRTGNSRPIIMVCCTDAKVRGDVETEIRKSGLLDQFPEFGTGQSALPLELPGVARALAGESTSGGEQDSSGALHTVAIGRGLVFLGQYRRYHATGGAIVVIGTDAYQLTVGHVGEPCEDLDTKAAAASGNLDECLFDGMSDDDETSGEESDTAIVDATSRGSRSPDDEGPYRLDGSGIVEDSETSTSHPSSPQASSSKPPPQSLRWAGSVRTVDPPSVSMARKSPVATQVLGMAALADRSSGGPNPGLDYALVPLGPFFSSLTRIKNEVHIQEPSEKTISVRKVAEVGPSETRIIAVTAFGGPSRGVMIPGATFVRGRGLRSFQKLYAIQLDDTHVYEGDCGSVVIGEAGELYGHIVRGCPGTSIAYMVPATEVFADLSARRQANVSLAVTPQIPYLFATRSSVSDSGGSRKGLLGPPEKSVARTQRHGHRTFIQAPLVPDPRLAIYHRNRPHFEEQTAYSVRSDSTLVEHEHNRVLGPRATMVPDQGPNKVVVQLPFEKEEKASRRPLARKDVLSLDDHKFPLPHTTAASVVGAIGRDTELEDLRRRNARIEADNDSLKSRVRELLRSSKEQQDDRVRLLEDELAQGKQRIADDRRRYEDLERRLKRLRENLDDHIEHNRRLTDENEMLRRNLEIQERQRRHGR